MQRRCVRLGIMILYRTHALNVAPGMGKGDSLEYYFASTGFYDFLPPALGLIGTLGFSEQEAIEAIIKVFDKARRYPPTRNRSAWFLVVFKEKLFEARADIIAFRKSNG